MKVLNIIRLILLRVLLSWWFIPCIWVIAWPLAFLMCGPKDATDMCVEITTIMVTGEV